jgi:hypothetical protein
MSDPPTPGQVAYEAYMAMLPERAYFPAAAWLGIGGAHRRAWEAAAQAAITAWIASPDWPTPAQEDTP